MLFLWNALLGGSDAFVLCLHSEGDVHVEILGKDAQSEPADCVGDPALQEVPDCPPCTDLVVGSNDLGHLLSNTVVTGGQVHPDSSQVAWVSTGPDSNPGPASTSAHRPRGPPDIVSLSEMIHRVIVLLL